MAAVIAFTPRTSLRPAGLAPAAAPAVDRLSDADVVRLARRVLADPRAWAAVAGDADPATLRAAQSRARALLAEALETI